MDVLLEAVAGEEEMPSLPVEEMPKHIPDERRGLFDLQVPGFDESELTAEQKTAFREVVAYWQRKLATRRTSSSCRTRSRSSIHAPASDTTSTR